MYPNKVPRGFGGKTAPKYHGTSTILTYRSYSVKAFLFLCQTHLERWLPKSSIFVSSDHKTQFQSEFQYRLANSKRLRLWWNDRKGFFLACLPNNFLAWRWCLMVVLETSWPQDATFFCNSPTVIPGDFLSSLTLSSSLLCGGQNNESSSRQVCNSSRR